MFDMTVKDTDLLCYNEVIHDAERKRSRKKMYTNMITTKSPYTLYIYTYTQWIKGMSKS